MSNFDLALDHSFQAYNTSLEIYGENKVSETADAACAASGAYFGLQKIYECIKYGEKGLEIIERIVQKYKIFTDLQTLEELYYLCGEDPYKSNK